MAIREASRRWTMPIRHWKQALNHFAILFEGRVPEVVIPSENQAVNREFGSTLSTPNFL
jgi:hypothetical protein